MSTPQEIFRRVEELVKQIEVKRLGIEKEKYAMQEDITNKTKAEEAIEELQKRIDRQKKRIANSEQVIKGLQNNIKGFVKEIKDISAQDREKGYSPNPLIEKESSEEIYNKAVNLLVEKGLNENGL